MIVGKYLLKNDGEIALLFERPIPVWSCLILYTPRQRRANRFLSVALASLKYNNNQNLFAQSGCYFLCLNLIRAGNLNRRRDPNEDSNHHHPQRQSLDFFFSDDHRWPPTTEKVWTLSQLLIKFSHLSVAPLSCVFTDLFTVAIMILHRPRSARVSGGLKPVGLDRYQASGFRLCFFLPHVFQNGPLIQGLRGTPAGGPVVIECSLAHRQQRKSGNDEGRWTRHPVAARCFYASIYLPIKNYNDDRRNSFMMFEKIIPL